MFERFTKAARATVERAQVEARAAGAGRIGTEHLLLGVAGGEDEAARALAAHGATPDRLRPLVNEGPPLDGEALAAIGIDLDEVRRRVDASFGAGALGRAGESARGGGGRVRRLHLPVSPRAKKALELALREALERGDRQIGAEHVLLGLLRDEHAAAVRVLRQAGVEAAAVREALSPVASRRGRGA